MNPDRAPLSRRLCIACAMTSLFAGAVHAQDAYPSKPIRIVIGYAPGGSVDMVGRVVGDILARQLNATVVVENVPGAAGVVGAQRVVSAKPDGYTLLAGSSNEMAGTKFVNAAQKYDPAVDLTPVSLTAQAPICGWPERMFLSKPWMTSSNWPRPTPANTATAAPALARHRIFRES